MARDERTLESHLEEAGSTTADAVAPGGSSVRARYVYYAKPDVNVGVYKGGEWNPIGEANAIPTFYKNYVEKQIEEAGKTCSEVTFRTGNAWCGGTAGVESSVKKLGEISWKFKRDVEASAVKKAKLDPEQAAGAGGAGGTDAPVSNAAAAAASGQKQPPQATSPASQAAVAGPSSSASAPAPSPTQQPALQAAPQVNHVSPKAPAAHDAGIDYGVLAHIAAAAVPISAPNPLHEGFHLGFTNSTAPVATPAPAQASGDRVYCVKKLSSGANYIHFHWTCPDSAFNKKFLVELYRKPDKEHETLMSRVIAETTHKLFENLCAQDTYFCKVMIVSADARLEDGTREIICNEKGPASKSRAYQIKEARPPVTDEVRRMMWAAFYIDDDDKMAGCMLKMPCLGCMARGQEPIMLSPLLTNVHAAHVIADAFQGPHGEHKHETWNFVPTCEACNLKMGTTNLIDWFYTHCKTNNDYLPLFTVLYRLWRARWRNIEQAAMLPPNLGYKNGSAKVHEFAIEVYKKGLPEFDGGRVDLDGELRDHEWLGGGFKTLKDDLVDAWLHIQMTPEMMRDSIRLIDKPATDFQQIVVKLSSKVEKASKDYKKLSEIDEQINTIFKEMSAKVDGLGP